MSLSYHGDILILALISTKYRNIPFEFQSTTCKSIEHIRTYTSQAMHNQIQREFFLEKLHLVDNKPITLKIGTGTLST